MLKTFGRIITAVGLKFWGYENMNDLQTRALRFGEEAIETMQAYQVPLEKVHFLVDAVYGRERGFCGPEIGDCLLTLLALASASRIDPDEQLTQGIERLIRQDTLKMQERNAEKKRAGF